MGQIDLYKDLFYLIRILDIIVEGHPKSPFSIATTPKCRKAGYSFPEIAPLTLDPYLIILSVNQGGIEYYFLSLWYDWNPVSWTIGAHSNHYTYGLVTYWYHITVCKLFVLRIVTCCFNCLLIIPIICSMKPCNCYLIIGVVRNTQNHVIPR